MAIKYLDLFVRCDLKEDNDLPRNCKTLSASPDIIAWGTSPAENPATLFAGNYNDNVGKDISYGEDNYIYVRAKNFKASAQSGTVIVYQSSKSNLSNPNAWTRLTTFTGNNSVPVEADNEGEIAVTGQPFIWNPFKPVSDDPYSLIAVMATDDNPNPVKPGGIDPLDVHDLVANNGGVGWVEYALPKPPEKGLTSTSTTAISLNNAEGDNLSFMVKCSNVPVGAQLAFSSDKNDARGNPIVLPKTTVTTPEMEPSIPVTLDANYAANITLKLFAEDMTTNGSYSLTFECLKTTGSGMSQKIVSLGGFATKIIASQDS